MNETTDTAAIFAPLWARKWLILLTAVLVAVASYFYYKHQSDVYSSTTQVYLGSGAEEQSQIGGSSNGGKRASAPSGATQAALINSSIIKMLVRAQIRGGPKSRGTRAALRGKAKAKSTEKSEFITITAEAASARGSALLANVTAQAYIKRQDANYRRSVQAAIGLARRQLRRIEAGAARPTSSSTGKSAAKGTTSTAVALQAATLSTKINQLESDLVVSEVSQINPAKPDAAELLSPKPRQNAIFGFAIGLLLASFAAYTLSRLDRRLRSLAAVEALFQTQILTVLPAVRHPIVNRDGQPAPAKSHREPLRRLHTTLQVGSGLGREDGARPRTILVVSADAGDGKSTLVANLALAQADAGARVAVVEADFRRPVQARLLDVSGSPGLAEVLSGTLALGEAMQSVNAGRLDVGGAAAHAPASAAATVLERSSSTGSVFALLGASTVANPPALLARPEMAELLRSLAEEFDYVLIDAPSPLQVSDVIPLLAAVDGIVIVARVGHTQDTSAQRLLQLLKQTPSAPVLGVVASAVSESDVEKYGFQSGHGRGWRGKLMGR
jgi:Mrp family chromosome partitioning ATPase/capsular polysaccharide biosynthesis protein